MKLTQSLPLFYCPHGHQPRGGNFLMTFAYNGLADYPGLQEAAYSAIVPLANSDDRQTVTIALSDLKPQNDKSPPTPKNWQGITELGIAAGDGWQPDRKLRNLRWVGGDETGGQATFPFILERHSSQGAFSFRFAHSSVSEDEGVKPAIKVHFFSRAAD